MKIIDLLNKIANGEELPKEIKWGVHKFKLWEKTYIEPGETKKINGTTECYKDLFADYIDTTLLNDEVEIIEEDKKIGHKEHYVDFVNLTNDEKFDYLYEMETRIIDYLMEQDK